MLIFIFLDSLVLLQVSWKNFILNFDVISWYDFSLIKLVSKFTFKILIGSSPACLSKKYDDIVLPS